MGLSAYVIYALLTLKFLEAGAGDPHVRTKKGTYGMTCVACLKSSHDRLCRCMKYLFTHYVRHIIQFYLYNLNGIVQSV
jgi:hypothetical protein